MLHIAALVLFACFVLSELEGMSELVNQLGFSAVVKSPTHDGYPSTIPFMSPEQTPMTKPVAATTSTKGDTFHATLPTEMESTSSSRPRNQAATNDADDDTATPISHDDNCDHSKAPVTLSAAMIQAILAIDDSYTDITLIQSSNLLADRVAETDSREWSRGNSIETHSHSTTHNTTWLQMTIDNPFEAGLAKSMLENPADIASAVLPFVLPNTARQQPTIDNGTQKMTTSEAPATNDMALPVLKEPRNERNHFVPSAAPSVLLTSEDSIDLQQSVSECKSSSPATVAMDKILDDVKSLWLKLKHKLRSRIVALTDEITLQNFARTSYNFQMMCMIFASWLVGLVLLWPFEQTDELLLYKHGCLPLAVYFASCCLDMKLLLPLYALTMPTILSLYVVPIALIFLDCFREMLDEALDAGDMFFRLAGAYGNPGNRFFGRYELI
jgi:hypothetical protein